MKKDKILIIGANGQLGTVLTDALCKLHGKQNVVASDIREPTAANTDCAFEMVSVLDDNALGKVIAKHRITQIYHLAAILSAKGEANPKMTWEVNMDGVLNVLELARERYLDKVYFPSSIAVFGTKTPHQNTPQDTILNPLTVYGISKLAGEMWCEYYHRKYNLDVRSLRYPGLISHETPPGGGTTDYAVDIYHKAVNQEDFDCFLDAHTRLPMMYMPDAIRATLELMQAPKEKITVRTSYNLGGMDFTPVEIYEEIKKHYPEFKINYSPDSLRQSIANSWSESVDDSAARLDWAWKPVYDLAKMTEDMILNLKKNK